MLLKFTNVGSTLAGAATHTCMSMCGCVLMAGHTAMDVNVNFQLKKKARSVEGKSAARFKSLGTGL